MQAWDCGERFKFVRLLVRAGAYLKLSEGVKELRETEENVEQTLENWSVL